jgi:hypothetical protein
VDVLAQKDGLDPQDERRSPAARVGLGALVSATEGWIAGGYQGDSGQRTDVSFGRMRDTCLELSKSEFTK